MPDENQHSSRISGGVLGVIALALAGGGAGALGFWVTGDGDAANVKPVAKPIIEGPADNNIDIEEPASDAASGDQDNEPASETVDGPDRIPAATDTEVSLDPVDTDLEAIPEPPRVAPTLPAINPPVIQRPQGRILEEAAFVVRFNDDPDLTPVLKQFRSDKAAAKKAFEKWAAQHPELSGLTLVRVNYSGETILGYRGADDATPVSNAKDMQARLNSLSIVRYADPDYTAFPGKGD